MHSFARHRPVSVTLLTHIASGWDCLMSTFQNHRPSPTYRYLSQTESSCFCHLAQAVARLRLHLTSQSFLFYFLFSPG